MTSYGAGTSDMSFTLAYTKTSKLITALYMVTDTMEKEEPIRLKIKDTRNRNSIRHYYVKDRL